MLETIKTYRGKTGTYEVLEDKSRYRYPYRVCHRESDGLLGAFKTFNEADIVARMAAASKPPVAGEEG